MIHIIIFLANKLYFLLIENIKKKFNFQSKYNILIECFQTTD